MRPYSIAVDSRGRDHCHRSGAGGVHIFDFAQQKYKFIERRDKDKDAMLAPQCVAVDAQDNIYVTDSETGKIFVFDSSGKYLRAIGSLKGGEGYFKRPTGIAVDSAGPANLCDRYPARPGFHAGYGRGTSCRRSARAGKASWNSTCRPSCGWMATT